MMSGDMTDKIPDATRPVPDTSKPSRELDFYIWSVLLGNGAMPTRDVVYSARDRDDNPVDMDPVTEDDWDEIPAYSSDRSAAFELAWSFDDVEIKIDRGLCSAWIRASDHHTVIGGREDFALVICQAAIQASKVK